MVGPEVHQYFNDQAREVDTFLYRRRTYEGIAEFWPTAERDPDSTPEVIEYAKLARPKPKLVFSNTLESAGWNTETVAGLRARPGTKHLPYASADLAATFMRLDLIDEYWLLVNPVALGGGTLLFGQLDAPVELSLVEARTFEGAIVLLRYTRP
jgi:dihydrofolate reductase